MTIGGVAALALAKILLPRYAEAQEVSFTDEQIRPTYVDYPSPGGNLGTMRGYLVTTHRRRPFPVGPCDPRESWAESVYQRCCPTSGGGWVHCSRP